MTGFELPTSGYGGDGLPTKPQPLPNQDRNLQL